MKAIAGYAPFADVTNERTGKLQVAIAGDHVEQSQRVSVLELSNDADLLEIVDREIYWWPKGNFLDSELDIKAIEEIVGPFTIRTKNTMERLTTKYLAE